MAELPELLRIFGAAVEIEALDPLSDRWDLVVAESVERGLRPMHSVFSEFWCGWGPWGRLGKNWIQCAAMSY